MMRLTAAILVVLGFASFALASCEAARTVKEVVDYGAAYVANQQKRN